MSAPSQTRTREEVARLGKEMYQQFAKPSLEPSDFGKYVAIDIDSGSFEMNSSSSEAVIQLRKRCPSAYIWLERVGHPTAGRI